MIDRERYRFTLTMFTILASPKDGQDLLSTADEPRKAILLREQRSQTDPTTTEQKGLFRSVETALTAYSVRTIVSLISQIG